MKYENEIILPAKRESDGLPVVGVDGFSYNERLLRIIFDEGSQVKYIGSFEGCTGIEFIDNMPATVEKIADFAFNGCTRLRKVTLNDGLKYIGISCFEGCESLESIKLPKSLKVLRENAFRVCTGLQTVEFDDNINFHDGYSYGFCNNVFDGCESLHTVKLPKNSPGYFFIPEGTFSWCGSLKSIEFPANTRRIEQSAFYRSGIENLDLTTITSEVFYVEGYYTFAACESLQSVTANGNFQFGSTSLYTFQGCKALETVTINGSGDDFIAITPDAFRWCENLKTVNVYRLKGTGDVNNEMDSVFVGCKSLQKVISTCPPELNKIGYSCFLDCESLEEVPIPEQAFKVNESAFRGCAALQSLDLANVTSIGTQAFNGCSALTSISINNLPTMEKEDAFDEWHFANTEIAVPDEKYSTFTSDAYWRQFSHFKHPSLFAYTEVTGGYSIRKSPYALNEDFTGMLVIPEQYNSGNVVAIAEGTFQGFTGLTGVTLPSGLTSIGSQAFAGCTGITTVINKAVSPLYGEECPDDIFDGNTYSKGNLYVPFGSLDAYKSFEPWSSFSDRIIQGFGERTLSAPVASREQGAFDQPFDLTLTNPNDIGTIYYYIINEGKGEGNVSNEVHTVETYSAPIRISANCTVVAQISDDTQCSKPVSLEYTLQYNTVSNNAGLLSMEPDKFYQVNVNLQGVKVNGGVLYARSSETSAAPSKPKETHTGFDSYEDGNKLGEYDQRDWVAIEGLTSEYERKQIEVGFVARYDGSKLIPVTTPVSGTDIDVELNTFGVANVFYGNYENTERFGWTDGDKNPYYPFFVKAKVNEVANFVGTVTVTEGKIELWGSGVCGKLNDKGLEIDANDKEINASEGVYQQIEGVLVADAEANGGVKLVALSKPITPTGVDALKTDGKATIYGTEGAVVVNGADGKVMIFDAMGRMVKSVSAEGAATVAMPAGYYIVRTAGTAKAVIVK
ncbi:MAG: leucine-rich repeat protein [Muribaculaceae bacterium]